MLVSHSFYGALIDPRVDHLGNDPDEWAMVWTDATPDIGWDVHGLLSPAWVFGDGLESGASAAWSLSMP